MYKLLIADDEMLEREAIKFIVNENYGSAFEMMEAVNGREAIEKAASFQPDLIFFDIKMPGINGLEAAATIRKTLPECRIVIVSAYHYFSYAQEALSLGADQYITKPASAEKVIETINKVIAGIDERRVKKRQEDEKDKKLKQITQYFEDELLVLIAYGEIEEKVIKEYFEVLNIQYQSFLGVIVSVLNTSRPADVESELAKRNLKKTIIEKIKNYFSTEGYNSFIRSVGQEIYILLLLDHQVDEYETRVFGIKLFSEVKDKICEEMQLNLNIGIGNLGYSLSELYNTFLQAKNALRYDPAPGAIVSFGDIKGNNKTIYPLGKEKQLYQSIIQGDLHNSLVLLEELMTWMVTHVANFENLKQKVYELLLVLLRETIINSNLTEFDIDTEELRRTVFLLKTTEEIGLFTKEYITNKINEINNIKKSRASALLAMAVAYLEHNYLKEISLEDVATIIQISPFYLSKLFKKEVGENFIDYLTKIRIHKAKEFLSNPLCTIKDVCYQVGYRDPNYFARVFKKICGITPTEYQEKNLR